MNQESLRWEEFPAESDSLEAKFREFHAANPHIYSELVRLAREARAAGRNVIGIRMLWERMRWDLFIQTKGDEYKLNDHLTSRYARLIQHQEPDLRGIFKLRTLRSQ